MATIFRATDDKLGREVAVKVLRPEYGADAQFVERFEHEAQAAASLSHPNIVQVYDYGTDHCRSLHRHGAGLGWRPRLGPGQEGQSAADRRGQHGPAGGRRARSRPRRRPRPSRHQAQQHPALARRPRAGGRLRHRPGRRRLARDRHRHHPRQRPLLQPRAGSRRHGHRGLGHLLAGPGDVRDAHRPAGLLGRLARRRWRWPGFSGSVPSPMAVRAEVPPALDAIVRWCLAVDPAARPSAAELSTALARFRTDPSGAAALAAAGLAAVPLADPSRHHHGRSIRRPKPPTWPRPPAAG